MKHWIQFIFYYYYLWVKIEPNRTYEWLRAKRGRRIRLRGAQRNSFYMHNRRQRIESIKNGRRDFGYKLIFIYLESISKVNPARPWLSMKAYISNSFIDWDVEFWHNLDSSFKFVVGIYWTKYNFPSKFDFTSDEDKNKHLLASCERIVKFCHTLLVLPSRGSMYT